MKTTSLCFLSPYFPKHFGGGEKYLLDCARVAATNSSLEVFVAIPGSFDQVELHKIKSSYQNFLGVKLDHVSFIESPIGTTASWWRRLIWTKKFDILYYLTDGSLFFSLAKKNILHIQIPFTDSKQSLLDKLKLSLWSIKNANSKFTQQVIEKHWQTRVSYVHHPMVEYQGKSKQSFSKKEKIILNIGRFFRQLHSKRQDVLVGFFKNLLEKYPNQSKGWKLIFVGGVEDKSYLDEVKLQAKGLPIEFYHSATHEQLWEFLDTASIYWHATGYGQDEATHPEKMEHFGISTVESLSAGCVPIVISKGGQPEIVAGELSSLLWKTEAECLAITAKIMANELLQKKYYQLSIDRAAYFGEKKFATTLFEMIAL